MLYLKLCIFGIIMLASILFKTLNISYTRVSSYVYFKSSVVIRRPPSSSVVLRRRPSSVVRSSSVRCRPSSSVVVRRPLSVVRRHLSSSSYYETVQVVLFSKIVFVGPKRGNSTMTRSTVTAWRKGDPPHYVEGENEKKRK